MLDSSRILVMGSVVAVLSFTAIAVFRLTCTMRRWA